MAVFKYRITLEKGEARTLRNIINKGTSPARTATWARVLLLANENGPKKTNKEISEVLMLAATTPNDIRKRYCERGLDGAIHDAPRPEQPKKITPEHEAFVVATACTDAPEGHDHWTLEALKNKLVETYDDLESVSHEWIRQMLMRAALKPSREKNVARAGSYSALSRAYG
jgi:transposase